MPGTNHSENQVAYEASASIFFTKLVSLLGLVGQCFSADEGPVEAGSGESGVLRVCDGSRLEEGDMDVLLGYFDTGRCRVWR